MNVMFVCGGTAGHINPALAVAAELRKKDLDIKILFVGAGRDLEKRLIPDAGYELTNIKMSGLSRGLTPAKILKNIKTVKNLFFAKREAGKLMCAFKPDAVVGTGGYICYPVIKRAAEMGIPTLIHESNAVPGLAVKLLSAHADKTLVSFPGLEEIYKKPQRVVFTGTPVRDGFKALSDGLGSASKKPLIVSFWGSLGAERLNEIMTQFIKLLSDKGDFRHIHATGRNGGAEKLKNSLLQIGVRDFEDIEIREYIDDMPTVMAAADIVLCRAGASTLAELTVMGKPAVLVPSPYVTNGHQEQNAEQLRKAGGALVLTEKECSGSSLYAAAESILKDRNKLQSMSKAQKAIGAPGAAERIAELILFYEGSGAIER